MTRLKDLFAIFGGLMAFLLLCGLLDQPQPPTACVASITDGSGNTHYISGAVAQISTH